MCCSAGFPSSGCSDYSRSRGAPPERHDSVEHPVLLRPVAERREPHRTHPVHGAVFVPLARPGGGIVRAGLSGIGTNCLAVCCVLARDQKAAAGTYTRVPPTTCTSRIALSYRAIVCLLCCIRVLGVPSNGGPQRASRLYLPGTYADQPRTTSIEDRDPDGVALQFTPL